MRRALGWCMTQYTDREEALLSARQMAHRVALKLARRFCPRMERADVIATADMALLEALQAYDPTRSVRFSTYAYPWVRGAIFRAGERFNRTSERERPLEGDTIHSKGPWGELVARDVLRHIPRRERRLVLEHLLFERPFEGLVRGCSASTARRRYHSALSVLRART